MILFQIPSILTIQERDNFISQWSTKTRQRVTSKVVVLFDHVSGYHHFHNRPLVGAEMLLSLIREPNNRYDRHAVKVVAPPIDQIRPAFRNAITRERDGQRVGDVAGKCIGRVPAHLSKLISNGLLSGDIDKCEVIFTGKIIHDGGPKLSMAYFITFHEETTADYYENEMLNFSSTIRDVYLSGLL